MTRSERSFPGSGGGRLLRALVAWLVAACLAWAPLAASAAPGHTPTPDAPRLEEGSLRVPPPPSSYNVYEAGWIRFAYPPSVRERVQPLIAAATAARDELGRRLGQPVLKDVRVYVARTPGEMATLAPEGAPFPAYAAGVAYPQIGLLLLTIAPVHPNDGHELDKIFRHELAHQALHDATDGHPVPRWFNEGFAVFQSGEASWDRLQPLWTATVAHRLFDLKTLERSFPADDVGVELAYAQAADIVRFLMRQEDTQRFHALIERLRGGQTFDTALEDAYGESVATLEYEWREEVSKRYTFWPILFGGGLVWIGAIGLVGWAYKRRKRRDRVVLARWEREEAAEDAAQTRRLAEAAAQERERVHIVLSRPPTPPVDLPPRIPEAEIPRVEHDGRWHTLH
ncbi:MAG: peptidase MA family metallohydrolase [Polyangiaceae bacterium]|nr:peptidase MA family metallohydrolase [Polyangiaceae bacterium]